MACDKLYEVKYKSACFTLYDEIESFGDYTDLLKWLYTAEKGEIMQLLLNSPGGRCDVGDSIIRAIKESNAFVKCVVEAPCYSMASLIALAGDALEFKENTYLMFHHYNTMYWGKGAEIELQHKAEYENLNKHLKSVCMPFLTEKECGKIIAGEDFYVKDSDANLQARMNRHFK